jgi:hypothetical protein
LRGFQIRKAYGPDAHAKVIPIIFIADRFIAGLFIAGLAVAVSFASISVGDRCGAVV